jgi:hypothetical protein
MTQDTGEAAIKPFLFSTKVNQNKLVCFIPGTIYTQFYQQIKAGAMDKLQLTGQTLGRAFNFRSGCMSCHALSAQYSNIT